MKKKHYIPVLTGDATHLKIEVYYSKGGMNYFTSSNEKRGIYISVTPVTKGENSERFVGFSGTKSLLFEMKRFNQKTLDTIEVDAEYEKQLIDHVCQKNNITLEEKVA